MNQEQEINPPRQKNVHVHYGAGKLGIGLVLPLIKPNTTVTTQLLVIQKNRDEWNKKIRTDLKEITLSNTDADDWQLSLSLKKLSMSFVLAFFLPAQHSAVWPRKRK